MNIPEERLFILAMFWRICYGVLHILLGLAVLKVIGMPLIDVVDTLMHHELTQDPNDLLYGFITHILTIHPIYVSYFLSFYFIFWGLVDMILSFFLIRHSLWAFPVSIVLIALFILYEIARFTQTRSLILLGVIFIDTIVLVLIWREYKRLKNPLKEKMLSSTT